MAASDPLGLERLLSLSVGVLNQGVLVPLGTLQLTDSTNAGGRRRLANRLGSRIEASAIGDS